MEAAVNMFKDRRCGRAFNCEAYEKKSIGLLFGIGVSVDAVHLLLHKMALVIHACWAAPAPQSAMQGTVPSGH